MKPPKLQKLNPMEESKQIPPIGLTDKSISPLSSQQEKSPHTFYVSPLMYAYQTLAQIKKGELPQSDKSSMFNKHRLISNIGKSHSNVMVGLGPDSEQNFNNLSLFKVGNGLIYSDGQFKASENSEQRKYIDG